MGGSDVTLSGEGPNNDPIGQDADTRAAFGYD
jgi:hypothetical protein